MSNVIYNVPFAPELIFFAGFCGRGLIPRADSPTGFYFARWYRKKRDCGNRRIRANDSKLILHKPRGERKVCSSRGVNVILLTDCDLKPNYSTFRLKICVQIFFYLGTD